MNAGKRDESGQEAASAAQVKAERKPRRRRWPWIILGVIALLAILVALLPTLLSLGPVRRYVVSRISERLNGQLEIKSWSLGWFSGFRFSGIKVTDAEARPVIEVASVNVPATIPSLLGSTKRLGETEVQGFKANVALYPDGTSNLAKLTPPAEGRVVNGEDAWSRAPTSLGMDVVGKLVVRDGEIRISPAKEGLPFLIGDLDVAVDISGLSNPIKFHVSAALGSNRAPLALSGTVRATKDGVFDPEAIDAQVSVALQHFDLTSVNDLAKQFGLPVDVLGSADADFDAQVRGTREAKVKGTVALNSLAASGGPLGRDRFALDRLNVRLDVGVAGKRADINEFVLDSSLLSAKVAGAVTMPDSGFIPSGTLSAEAQVDLAGIAAQLPNTLSLRKGLDVESGALALESTIVSRQNVTNLALSLRMEDLAASQQGRRIALDEPVVLALKATRDDGGPRLDLFELSSSFAKATGRGNMEQFDLTLTSDLGAAMREAAKFIELGDAEASGKATVAVRVSGAELARKRIDTSVNLSELRISGFTPEPIRLDKVQVQAGAFASLTPQYALEEVSEVNIEVGSPFAEVGLSAERLQLAEGFPTVSGGQLRFDANLGDVASFARGIGIMPQDLSLGGRADIVSGLSAANGVLKAEPLRVALSELEVTLGGKSLREPEILITGAVEVQPNKRRAALEEFACQFSAGNLDIVHLDAPDWTRMPAGVGYEIHGHVDLEKALSSAREFVALPEGMNVKGQAELTVRAGAARKEQQAVNLSAVLKPLEIVAPNVPTLHEEVGIDVAAALRSETEELTIETATLNSNMLKVTANGSFRDWSGGQNVDLVGEMAWDLDRIGPVVAAFTGKPIEMRGKSVKPFNVKMSLGATDWREMIRQAVADAGVSIPLLRVMGIEVESVDIPVAVGQGHALVTLRSRLNQGTVLIPADLDFNTTGPPLLTLPQNTALLSDVEISDVLANQVLARVSPIFTQCVVLGGKVGLTSSQFRAPLGEQLLQRATMEGELVLEGVELSSSGLLQPVLELIGVGAVGISIPDANVRVVLKEGKIQQAPLRIQVLEYGLILSGTIGLDTSLDMFVDVPVTADMLGENQEVFELLKDEVVRIHVTGTAASPKVSRDIFKENLSRLVKSAAEQLLRKRGEDFLRKGIEDILR